MKLLKKISFYAMNAGIPDVAIETTLMLLPYVGLFDCERKKTFAGGTILFVINTN